MPQPAVVAPMARALLPTLLLGGLLLLPAAHAADAPVLEAITGGSPDNGRALTAMNAHVAWLDGDGDRQPDADEPVYLDLDASGAASVGDLRLTAFDTYGAGTEVAVTNRDTGRALFRSNGWFGQAGGAWYADLDGGKSVSEHDVRLDGVPQRVTASSGERGQPLSYPTIALLPGSVAVDDLDRDGIRDRGESAYLDLDTSARSGPPIVGPGDLRFKSQGAGLDNAPTRAEFDAATGREPSTGSDGAGSTGGGVTIVGDEDDGGSGWGTPETVLLVLGLVNLAGLAVLYRRSQRPRNPFK